MKKTASLLVVLAALFTMSSTFSAEAPKFGADRHVAHGMACASCHLSFIEESQIISRGPLSPKGSLVF